MKDALRRQDLIAKLLRRMNEHAHSLPDIVREYQEAGITLRKHDPKKDGYPEDRNMI